MKKFLFITSLIASLSIVLTACNPTSKQPPIGQSASNKSQTKENPADSLFGVWEYDTIEDYYTTYKFTFGKLNGKYVGTYSATDHYNYSGKHRVNLLEFEYFIENDELILRFKDGTEKREKFAVKNNILTYQKVDYSLSKQEKPFNGPPSDEEYTNLMKGAAFFDIDTGAYTDIYSLPDVNENYYSPSEPRQYAYCDLDNDGIDELLIQYSETGDTAILHWRLGEWEAYYVSFRGILDLKVDGTAYGSGGADSSSIHRFSFDDTTALQYEDIVTSDTGDYTKEGFACDEKTANNIISRHFDKQSIVWLNFEGGMC